MQDCTTNGKARLGPRPCRPNAQKCWCPPSSTVFRGCQWRGVIVASAVSDPFWCWSLGGGVEWQAVWGKITVCSEESLLSQVVMVILWLRVTP